MIWNRKRSLLALMMVAGCALSLGLPVSFGWSGAYAQGTAAPPGHRQPKAGDVPSGAKDDIRSPEDIAVDRAVKSICRGCSPPVPVRNLPRYEAGRLCPASSVQDNDKCRTDEETARNELKGQWTQFTEKARADCIQANELGERPSYVRLRVCLKQAQQ